MFLNVNHFHGVPDASQAAGDHRLANFLFQDGHVGNCRPARAGNKNTVGAAGLGVETLGNFV
ncbi:MAG: hypothetical protein E6J73_22815 [Deltaproteobacteria bacterium]|nr:MAG: hypothetical protein E6J73_22815 [Deltaproteobacteria bacterium]